ncbi:FliM/FliN family flagellar motor C-terminal domain-containing protein [Porphyrobacter sp. ULC335]|uniref:FliM/FliN family flagellar motor C-terminal domain-containing protein n=1 Tax=Porphyrobacter sp. ULC335 TaxID=2854260 RepID=UPI002220EDEF|nr:FliM/FliN family flagellar motor C-terminal domain-containing protein [Porphyrobacter sp. ULC335]UYV16744.1 FliM/FliN family flagellar motor C-terminal domain-containing protein [Porphyrobacter sp. ULC335]
MRMGHAFAPVRAAAVHCPELTSRGPRPEESAALMAAWRRDLSRLLADDLSGLLSGDRLDVSISEPERLSGADALRRIGQIAANSLLRCGASGETALLSFDFATAIALTDRSFGGDGRIGGGLPELLPRSAALLVEETATMIADAITRASFGDMPPPSGMATRGEVIVRSESAARLKPFALEAETLIFTLDIANRQGCTWRASLVVATERMARLLPGGGRRPRSRTPRTSASGMAAPFATMPLPLHVVLAEFDLSLTRLQSLAPGDTIPLAMGRQVPLMVGEAVLAHGSVGTAEDRMAIRLTRFPNSAPASAEGVAP